jgi:hypothetical protein
MQQLLVKLENVPRNTPLVPCSTSSGLNRVERLSDQNVVLTNNNLEVDLPIRKNRQDLRVPVINMRGKPLMPCRRGVARRLLEEKKAVVVSLYPFVIKLTIATGETVQKCKLGIDVGYKNIGFSIVTNKKELICGTLELDGKTSERLANKAMYRKGRRNKLWYREPRFNNRIRSNGWLPPSVERRYQTHLSLIRKLFNWYPINKIIIETANFDIQKINNPDIQGKDYQQGSMFQYQNTRAYLFARENGLCQYCSKEFSKGNSSHIHHIIPKPKGTDKPDNLALLHENCHTKLHKKKDFGKLKKNKQFKAETFMSIIGGRFLKDLPLIKITFGYITNIVRNALKLDKTHYNDAFVIAEGLKQLRASPITIKQKHKNNRALQKNRNGYKPFIRRQRYTLQPGDIVKIINSNKRYTVKGVHSYGNRVKVCDNEKVLDFKTGQIAECYNQKTLMWPMGSLSSTGTRPVVFPLTL